MLTISIIPNDTVGNTKKTANLDTLSKTQLLIQINELLFHKKK